MCVVITVDTAMHCDHNNTTPHMLGAGVPFVAAPPSYP